MIKEKITPEVGMGCTECWWSDTHACTITKISPTGKTIWYKRDVAKIVSGSCQDGSAKYVFEDDPNAYENKATLRKKHNVYKATGTNCTIIIGTRHEYFDPHF